MYVSTSISTHVYMYIYIYIYMYRCGARRDAHEPREPPREFPKIMGGNTDLKSLGLILRTPRKRTPIFCGGLDATPEDLVQRILDRGEVGLENVGVITPWLGFFGTPGGRTSRDPKNRNVKYIIGSPC